VGRHSKFEDVVRDSSEFHAWLAHNPDCLEYLGYPQRIIFGTDFFGDVPTSPPWLVLSDDSDQVLVEPRRISFQGLDGVLYTEESQDEYLRIMSGQGSTAQKFY
jgi:hypothetical protein